MKFTKKDLADNLSFYQSPDINCIITDNDDNELDVNMGLMVEIMDTTEFDDHTDENYPFIVSIGLMASHPHSSFNECDSEPSQASLLYDCNSYMGSIPVDHILINNIEKGIEDLVSMFTVGQAKLNTIKQSHGTIAAQQGRNSEFKYLSFATQDDAQVMVDYIINNRASALSVMIGFILDRPINLAGDDGWSQVNTMVFGCEFNKRKQA